MLEFINAAGRPLGLVASEWKSEFFAHAKTEEPGMGVHPDAPSRPEFSTNTRFTTAVPPPPWKTSTPAWATAFGLDFCGRPRGRGEVPGPLGNPLGNGHGDGLSKPHGGRGRGHLAGGLGLFRAAQYHQGGQDRQGGHGSRIDEGRWSLSCHRAVGFVSTSCLRSTRHTQYARCKIALPVCSCPCAAEPAVAQRLQTGAQLFLAAQDAVARQPRKAPPYPR